jgi:hypothetical protein
MTTETTAPNPNEAAHSSETPVNTTTEVVEQPGNQQQQPNAETPAETPETKVETPEQKSEEPQPKAPAEYTFTAPEGQEYDGKMLEAYTAAARKADLTQEAAQTLIQTMAPAIAAHQAEQVRAIQDQWVETSKTDTEFGGVKLTENLGVARKALDQFGTPELRTLLEQSGLTNHPEVIRVLYRVGKAISEDTFVGGRKVAAPDSAKSFYPNSNME